MYRGAKSRPIGKQRSIEKFVVDLESGEEIIFRTDGENAECLGYITFRKTGDLCLFMM